MRILTFVSVISHGFGIGVALATPPANDSFASRAVVTTAGTTGTNKEASVEAGEPAPRRDIAPAGTVWWAFTPVSSGWYEISTEGSELDTVLTVYQGAALENLVRLAAADDDAMEPGVTTSRLQFHAAAGVAYAIQVGSFNQTTGTVALSVEAVSQPSNRVVSLTCNPSAPFETGSAEQPVSITFGLEQNDDLASGTVFLARPDGTLLSEVAFSAANRISGTGSAGTYNVNVSIPRYAPAGNYPLWIIASSVNALPGEPDLQAGGWVWTSLPSTVTPHLAVTNSGLADTTAPALAGAAIPQPSVNVTNAGVIVPVNLQITDDLSGFTVASVSLEQVVTATQTDVLATGTVTAANRTSGSALNGQYTVQLFVPQDAPAGVWNLRCELTDGLGNTVSAVSPATLTVHKTPFSAWAIARGLTGSDALPAADPDRDGQTNLAEFAFHTDPKRVDLKTISRSVPDRVYLFQGAAPLQYLSNGELHLRFLRRRGANLGTATTVPQFGSSLTDWSPATEMTVTPLSADWEMVDARDTAAFGSSRRRFGRVLVTTP
jgi:hypothetical protein